MSVSKLQDKPVIVGSPISEFAVNEIQLLSDWCWIVLISSLTFFGVSVFYYPETYAPESPGLRNYKIDTDNDFKGMCFLWLVTDQ
jgi:hypothetical protein